MILLKIQQFLGRLLRSLPTELLCEWVRGIGKQNKIKSDLLLIQVAFDFVYMEFGKVLGAVAKKHGDASDNQTKGPDITPSDGLEEEGGGTGDNADDDDNRACAVLG